MVNNSTIETVSNIITYNSYYGLFLTYVFPILLLVLIVLMIGYLASINRKLKYVFNEENSETEYVYKDNQEQANNKTLYDATIVPAIIISCLIVFLTIVGLILYLINIFIFYNLSIWKIVYGDISIF